MLINRMKISIKWINANTMLSFSVIVVSMLVTRKFFEGINIQSNSADFQKSLVLRPLTRPHEGLLQVSLHHSHRFHTKRKLLLFSCKEVTVNYYLSLFLQSAPLSAPLWTRWTDAGLLSTFSPNIYANHLAWFSESGGKISGTSWQERKDRFLI